MEYRIVNDTQLYHFGVPGMKWGVRKAPERTGNGTRQPRRSSLLPRKELRPAAITKAGFRAISRSRATKKNTKMASKGKEVNVAKPKYTQKKSSTTKAKPIDNRAYAKAGAQAATRVIAGVGARKLGSVAMKSNKTSMKLVGAGLKGIGTASMIRGTALGLSTATVKYHESKNKKSK